jgi:tRNA 2-thiocytidine biosynthesis protein TtcA
MMPVQVFFEGKIKVIRPLYMIEEHTIQKYVTLMEWPTIDMGCPTSGKSKREDVKKMLKSFYRGNKKIKGNIFHALQNVKPEYLPV